MTRLERLAEELCSALPVGTPVRYWTSTRNDPPKLGVIEDDFSVLGGHTVVGWVSGCRGCVAATHIEALASGGGPC
jgi:hypothetical protein